MLFAAGFGTRMAPLTNSLPKPLIRVAGRPLVDHALDLLDGAGTGRIVANTHYKAEMMEQHLAERGVMCLREPEILDTGGGLKNAIGLLGTGTVLTMNTDSVWAGSNPVEKLLAAWRPDTMDALLLMVPRDHALGHSGAGDFEIDCDGRINRGLDMVYTGLQILKTDALHSISKDKFSLNVVWDLIGAKRRLFGMPYAGQWCDVGRPENIGLAESMLGYADV